MTSGPLVEKPQIPQGQRYHIAIAWMVPDDDSEIVEERYPEANVVKLVPKFRAASWGKGGQKKLDAAWEHMKGFQGEKQDDGATMYWAVYAASTMTELFGRGSVGLEKVKERLTLDCKRLGTLPSAGEIS